MKFPILLLVLILMACSSSTDQLSSDLIAEEGTYEQSDTLELTMDAQLSVCIGYGCIFDCDNITIQKGEFQQRALSLFVYAGQKLNTIDQRITPNRCSVVFVKSAVPEGHVSRLEGFTDEQDGTYWKLVEVRRVQ